MTAADPSQAVADSNQVRVHVTTRRWLGVIALVLLLAVANFAAFFALFDAREDQLFQAWMYMWLAGSIWLLTNLKRRVWKIVFAVCVLVSFGGVTQAVGLWHVNCFEHRDDSSTFAYCLPGIGASS